jgi:hypothetical protein
MWLLLQYFVAEEDYDDDDRGVVVVAPTTPRVCVVMSTDETFPFHELSPLTFFGRGEGCHLQQYYFLHSKNNIHNVKFLRIPKLNVRLCKNSTRLYISVYYFIS